MSEAPTHNPLPASRSRRRLLALGVPVLLSGTGVIAVATHDPIDRSADGVAAAGTATDEPADVLALLADERSLDGTGNNLDDPDRGAAGTIYPRVAPAGYADGIGEPETGPAERSLSNRIFNDENQNVFSENGVSHWGFVWGQFIDHTIGLRATADDEEMTIAFDPDDPLEEFSNDLGAITTDRSAIADGTGVDTPANRSTRSARTSTPGPSTADPTSGSTGCATAASTATRPTTRRRSSPSTGTSRPRQTGVQPKRRRPTSWVASSPTPLRP